MFDVKKFLIKVQGGRQYLPVAARLVWFREEHPAWGIETKPIVIDVDKQYAIFEATVYDENGKLMAKGTKMEDFRGFPDYVEKSETGAIGRALAVCGFGTQFAPDLDELDAGRFVDSPQTIRNGADSDEADRFSRRVSPEPVQNRRPVDSVSYRFNERQTQRPPQQAGPALPPAQQTAPRLSPTRPEYRQDGSSATSAANARWDDSPGNGVASEATSTASTAGHTESDSINHSCSACGRELKASQEALSLRKYGIALCPTCQKERQTAEAAG